MKVTKVTEHSVELRHAYADTTSGPVGEEGRKLLLAGLRALNPAKVIPDDVEIRLSGRDIEFKWSETVEETS